MNEWGKVVALKGRNAVLSIQRSENCDSCRRCRPGRGDGEMIMEAKNKAGAQIGDTVEVKEDEVSFTAKIIVRMGIPFSDGIIGGIIGYILSRVFHQPAYTVVWVAAVGLISMIISYLLSGKLLINLNQLKSNKFIVSSVMHTEG